MVKPHHPLSRGPGILSEALHTLVSQIPNSTEPAGTNPDERAKSLGKTAALKAAAISGSFTLPPGPLGMATVVPDLLAVWRVQQQLVADIAATYGKTNALTSETMVISLFKHGGVALTKPLFTRQGHEVVVQRIANRTLLQLLEKIAVRVAQRIAAKSVSRWLPVLGALGAGAYSYYDTTHVARSRKPLPLAPAAARARRLSRRQTAPNPLPASLQNAPVNRARVRVGGNRVSSEWMFSNVGSWNEPCSRSVHSLTLAATGNAEECEVATIPFKRESTRMNANEKRTCDSTTLRITKL